MCHFTAVHHGSHDIIVHIIEAAVAERQVDLCYSCMSRSTVVTDQSRALTLPVPENGILLGDDQNVPGTASHKRVDA
jgi:hypothetical protein